MKINVSSVKGLAKIDEVVMLDGSDDILEELKKITSDEKVIKFFNKLTDNHLNNESL